ncbi:MAG: hypothetical protein ACTSQZ_01980 [Candidatus Thorarchaeota archaeon]
MYSNAAILSMAKSAISTDDLAAGGLLSPEDATAFITTIIDQTAILKAARFEPMVSNEKNIDIFDISRRQLRKKEEARAPQNRGKMATGRNILKSVKTMLPIEVSDETFENNIEGEGFEQNLLDKFGIAVGNDVADLSINGDEASTGDPDSDFLITNNGWLEIAKARAGTYDTTGGTDYEEYFKNMLKQMPNKFKANLNELRFFCSSNTEIEYRASLSERVTSLGDAYLDQDRRARFMGVLVEPIEYMPDDIFMLTTYLNLIYGVRFGVKIERDKDIFAGVRQYAITMEFDFELGIDEALIIGYDETPA